MKKLYVLGIVLLLAIAVQAGPYPDDDMDGICETPFCEQIDTCPKVACEYFGIDVENCVGQTRDQDGDGIGDSCDPCPSNPSRTEEPCGRGGSGGGSGGGGGATGGGCRSGTNFNGALHQTNGWSCITDNDCQTTANKLGLNPADYACVITSSREVQNIVTNNCMCASVLKTEGAAGGFGAFDRIGQTTPTEASPPVPTETVARTSRVASPPARERQPIAGKSFEAPASTSTGDTSGIPVGLLAGLGVLLAAGAGAYLYTRPKKRR